VPIPSLSENAQRRAESCAAHPGYVDLIPPKGNATMRLSIYCARNAAAKAQA